MPDNATRRPPRIVMVVSREKAAAFINYARDTEGMEYDVGKGKARGAWKVTTDQSYDPQVERALIRNFNDEWRVFNA